MHPSPPVRASQLQLAVEQPSKRKDAGTSPKWYPTSKTKKPQQDGRRINHDRIKSHTCQVSDLQTGKTIIPRSSCTLVICNTMSDTRGPDKGTGNPQGIWPWSPVGFDYRSEDWGKQRLQSYRAQTNFACTKTRRRGAVTSQETEPKLLLVLEGLLWA